MKKQAGFTLIELIVVIVILGVLAATALPKFVNLGGDARSAAVAGVAGAMASASSINYGNRSINSSRGAGLSTGGAATICDKANPAWGTGITGIMQGGLPSNYTLVPLAGSVLTCTANGIVQCEVGTTGNAEKATATITCID